MMKYFVAFLLLIILLIIFQFIFFRSIPILGAFPVIKSKIVMKSNGEIILKIIQKGTYQIDSVSLYYKSKKVYTETEEESEPSEVNKISDLPKVKMPYRERVVYISLPKNVFDKITPIEGMNFTLECYGTFDQYFSANGRGFKVESKVIYER